MQPDAADQSRNRPAPESEGEDLLLRLTREHRDAGGLILALQRWTGSGAGDSVDTARELITDLVRHSVAERVHLLPLVRRYVPDGDAAADRIEAAQQELEQQVRQFEQFSMGPDFRGRLEVVDALVTQHADELETHVFPALAEACPAEELRDAGHRSAHAPGAGLVDRLRDLFRS